jgi:hypothetical protein
MHQWQLLQPTAAWQQWIAKAGVAFVLALTFGVGLPVLLASVVSDESTVHLAGALAMVCVLLTAVGLYLSSVSTSAVRAMVATLPAGVGLALLVQAVYTIAEPAPIPTLPSIRLFVAIVTPALIGLAFANHQSIEQRWPRILTQALSLGAVVVIALLAAR